MLGVPSAAGPSSGPNGGFWVDFALLSVVGRALELRVTSVETMRWVVSMTRYCLPEEVGGETEGEQWVSETIRRAIEADDEAGERYRNVIDT